MPPGNTKRLENIAARNRRQITTDTILAAMLATSLSATAIAVFHQVDRSLGESLRPARIAADHSCSELSDG
jgi:hypothetical protein